MEFLKKHYEKIILSVVLLGLALAAGALPFALKQEKDKLDAIETRFAPPIEVKPGNLKRHEEAMVRYRNITNLAFSGAHNLFNPVIWRRRPDGTLIKVQTGNEAGAGAMVLTKINPLLLTLSIDKISTNTSSFSLLVVHENPKMQINRRKQNRYFIRTNDTKFEGFYVRNIAGSTENPFLTIELPDGDKVTVTTNRPYKKIEGYSADLSSEQEKFTDKKIDDRIVVDGETNIVVNISSNEVVLSNLGKKTTVPLTSR